MLRLRPLHRNLAPASKSVHAYDEAHREVELTYFTWKNGWELSSRITRFLQRASMLSESIYQQWDMGWVNMYYDLLSYNGATSPRNICTRNGTQVPEWLAQQPGTYLFSYDAEGRLIGEIVQTDWNYPSGILSDQDKSTNTIRGRQRPGGHHPLPQIHPLGEWAPWERSLFTYFAPEQSRKKSSSDGAVRTGATNTATFSSTTGTAT
ncbi:MAG: hypothetical protein H6559_19015 [Lewinellaceae bacterium]|nr:hypothetical protein [Lewinellaceae bacterium]